MKKMIQTPSKPIAIIQSSQHNISYDTSYNHFIADTNYINYISPNISPNISPLSSKVSNMKKILSLDNFWPNTPPSYSPKQDILSKIKSILNIK